MKENPDYGIRKILTWLNPESSNICCWIRNPWFWKSGTHSKESWILLPVIQKPSSTCTESGNPESTPQNPESKTRTPFHGFPHSRTSGKWPPKARRLGGCLRVSNRTSLFREEVPRHLLLSKDCLHAVCICEVPRCQIYKVVYTLGSRSTDCEHSVYTTGSVGRLQQVRNYKTVSPKSGSGCLLEVVVFCLE